MVGAALVAAQGVAGTMTEAGVPSGPTSGIRFAPTKSSLDTHFQRVSTHCLVSFAINDLDKRIF